MKIAYIHDAVYPFVKGGAEKRLYEISKRMAERGHDVHVFGAKWWDGPSDIVLDGVKLHGVYKSKSLYSKGRRSIKDALLFSTKLLFKLRNEEFDIIDCYQSPILSSFAVKLSVIGKKTKFILSWYEVWRNYWYEYAGAFGFFGKIAERAALALPGRIIVPSNKTRNDLVSMGCKKPLSLVHNGINFEAIQKIEPSKEKYDIIDVARLITGKRIDLLLEAASILKRDFPNMRVAIVGDGPEMNNLKETARKMGIEKNVEFLGFLESEKDVISRIKASKVFVHPSIQEGGSSIVLFEANACGLPVIAVKHPVGIDTELIDDGKNGYFADVSGAAIADKVKLILRDSKLRESMKKQSIESSKKYDWDNIVKSVEEAYGV